jgi:hypothetical protein
MMGSGSGSRPSSVRTEFAPGCKNSANFLEAHRHQPRIVSSSSGIRLQRRNRRGNIPKMSAK